MSAYHELQRGKLYRVNAGSSKMIYSIFDDSKGYRRIGEVQAYSIVLFVTWRVEKGSYFFDAQDLWLQIVFQDTIGWIQAAQQTDTLVEIEEPS